MSFKKARAFVAKLAAGIEARAGTLGLSINKRFTGNHCVKMRFCSGRVPEEYTLLRKNAFFLVLAARSIYLWTSPL